MRKELLMILGMLCLILIISTVARAEKLSIPACGFIAEGHYAEQLQIHSGFGDYIYRKNISETFFYTPVYLPHGSIVKWVRFHVIDNDSNNNMECGLIRVNKYTGSPNPIYDVWTSGDSSSVRQFTSFVPFNPAHTLVNNDVCTYYVVIGFVGATTGLDRRVYGITIYYE